MSKKGKLILVGAGPGDPDLFTLKGVKALAQADIVLYDALANDVLLEYARKSSEQLFVGKRKGVPCMNQDEINALIIEKAHAHGTVVRLKGGDPFIFGRGHEEVEAALANGLEVEIVPGISSCYSVPELQNIPITKRGIARSFWVVTATDKDHQLPQDIYDAAKSNATVVILMGVHKLPEIVEIFKKEGKSQLPIALISNGSRDNEAIAMGTVDTIEAVVKATELKPPAIIVAGEVVKLHPEYTIEIAKHYGE